MATSSHYLAISPVTPPRVDTTAVRRGLNGCEVLGVKSPVVVPQSHLQQCQRRVWVWRGASGDVRGRVEAESHCRQILLHLVPQLCVCVCVCVCEREREKQRQRYDHATCRVCR